MSIIIAGKGGGIASSMGAGLTTSLTDPLSPIQPIPYLTTLPEQILGLVNLDPCTSPDCRDSLFTQRTGFRLPVFGISGATSSTYENDFNTFRVLWPGQPPAFIIQQLQDNFFKPTSQYPGQWLNVATIVDNTYGTYNAQGTIPNYPNQAQFTVNWGSVLSSFGNGIFRITVQEAVATIAATQASLVLTISSSGFPKLIQGTFYIGAVAYALYYNGTYTGYLAYLAGLINTDGTYSATIQAGGITIYGKNGALSNGTVVKQILTNTSEMFYANLDTSAKKPPMHNDVISVTATGVTIAAQGFPQPFSSIVFNYGGYYNGDGKYTAGIDPVQVFSGRIWFQCKSTMVGYYSGGAISIWLVINGVQQPHPVLVPCAVYAGNGIPTEAGFVFPPTNGVVGNPPRLNPGDVVELKTYCATDLSISAQGTSTIGTDLGGAFWNTSQATTSTTLGTLSGGVNASFEYQCSLASPEFELWGFNCDRARGTIKFETNFTGTIGDRLNPGNLFDNENITPQYDSIRLPGFFGKWSAKYEEILQEYGFNPATTFGTITTVRDKQIGKFKLNIFPVPYELIRRLSIYGFMPPGLLVSDYNFNNADWYLSQYPVKKAGGIEPKYYHESHFSGDQNWKNRRASIKDMDFEEGVQSLIYSYVDLIASS